MCRAFRAASYVRGKSSFRALFALYDQDKDGCIDSKEWLHLGKSSRSIGGAYILLFSARVWPPTIRRFGVARVELGLTRV